MAGIAWVVVIRRVPEAQMIHPRIHQTTRLTFPHQRKQQKPSLEPRLNLQPVSSSDTDV